ncbi:MAG TPA: imidazolonepropionase [Steroidobacteraceae bacterium]|nr:imidazolonepropionase [Steroidobacteraceae bacterium]
MPTLWRNARIATCNERGDVHERGAIVSDGPVIVWVGPEDERPVGLRPRRTIDLGGRWLTPGLIDCHTHLVFAGERATEFARRTSGASYSQIAREGGGILSTVRATRAASTEALVAASAPRLAALLREGVTTVEIKSGYALDLDGEARMLRVAKSFEASHPLTVLTSFLAAHALPPEFDGRADDYIDTICQDWLPRLAQEQAAAGTTRRGAVAPLIDAVDAYCEDIAFSAAQCDRLFTAARALGLPVRLHAEQLSRIGGSAVAARHGALCCDHLEYASEADVDALAAAGTTAVLLPVAFYELAEKQRPPIAALRRRAVPIAVASDCNPGSAPGASLLLAMHMARRSFGLTTAEVLAGVTSHAARALGEHGRRGALRAGFAADLAAWSIDSLDELGYWAAFNPCSMVVKAGEVVLEHRG